MVPRLDRLVPEMGSRMGIPKDKILDKLGIDPQDLLGNLPGGLGDKLGL
jgi:hypothetical protein